MESVDVLIIGSGFGGAVMACRLAQQGRQVLVLERGKRWTPESYPSVSNRDWLWRESNPDRHHGWLDLRLFGDMSVLAGCGVGGGSLIYASVSVDAHPDAFAAGWPGGISHERLQPFYARVESMLTPQHLPRSQWTPRTLLMQEAAEKTGNAARFSTVPQAVAFSSSWHHGLDQPHSAVHSQPWVNAFGKQQGTCVHCGNCDTGCAVQAKNTLDLNYLAVAEQHGAEVRALHHVRNIAPRAAGGYRVSFRDLNNALDGFIDARQVIVAAGSIGSTELLLRCRDQHRSLPHLSALLGKRWSANGDFVTPAYYRDREISPTRGPTISACIDFSEGGGPDGLPVFIEDGGFPDVFGNALERLAARGWLGRLRVSFGRLKTLLAGLPGIAPPIADTSGRRDALRHVMPWFGQARDAASGEMYLGRPWYAPWRRHVLKMRWDYRPNEQVMQAVNAVHEQLSEATGGVAMTPPSWGVFRNLVTPHPLGGCVMGNSAEDGVVDHTGAVFGYPGLYVVDGAIVPCSLGINPSKTIAALAERSAGLFPR